MIHSMAYYGRDGRPLGVRVTYEALGEIVQVLTPEERARFEEVVGADVVTAAVAAAQQRARQG